MADADAGGQRKKPYEENHIHEELKFSLVRSILNHRYYSYIGSLLKQAESTIGVVDRLNLLGNASVGNVI